MGRAEGEGRRSAGETAPPVPPPALGHPARRRVAAIIGPTAVGKTALALDVAKRIDAEIISVDSRQVYRYMDVGTDKATPDMRRDVPHHLIDVADPDEPFSVSTFVDMALAAARRIWARGREALFVGGTPFYHHALFSGSMNASLPHDAEVRRRWEALAASEGPVALHERLRSVDPASAERLHPNDVFRVSRALELWELTGVPPSRLWAEGEKRDTGLDVLYVGLTRPREDLFARIERRLGEELASGFPEEVAWLIAHGFDERFAPMRGLGYRELAAHHRGQLTLEEASAGAVARTKAFARRQMTWAKRSRPSLWYDVSAVSPARLADDVTRAIVGWLEGRGPEEADAP
ncbi:MAG: tRNA (adenosine(37)-N6)-dimethylallyltransferase MiaA [Synergistaceae bacterium]|nr:tRNA (adenosine(37)-N6)-dimethylallyltransferase MiaA [Synergistaceae bacterium]